MESREHVYLRLFSDEMSRAIKRRKGDAPLVVGSPPFAFRRVRLFGIVVELQHADSSSWLSLDDATGVTRVLCQGFAQEKAKLLRIGSSFELFAHVNSSDNEVVADNLRDTSNEPFADVMSMLETMDACQKYFSCVLAPIDTAGMHDLSPIKPRPVDSALIEELVCGASKGVSLAQLCSAARASESDVVAVLQNMMESGLCYSNKDLFFPL